MGLGGRMKSAIFGIVFVVCAVAGAGAAEQVETLIVPPYPAATPWKKITDQHDTTQLMIEWIPADQNEDNIADILTEQAFSTDQDASTFVTGILKRVVGACRRASVNGPKSGVENGYPVAYAQAYCVGQTGANKDVDIFIKAIRGHDMLYVVQREFRRPAVPNAVPGITPFSKDQLAEVKARLEAQGAANDFLVQQIQLCPSLQGSSTCPATSAPAPVTITQTPQEPAGNDDVSASFGFAPGKTTTKEIIDKFGTSSHQTHAPDGRHTFMYFAKGIIVVFLFDKDDVLIRTLAYSDPGR
jgi:hypothetical protein